jgi:NAD(P)-dependent dehydrogenase (short-subunit alcohol dehydrogenase family)
MEKQRLLEGQTALVTGGSSGMGEAIALAAGRAGANVAVNYHSGDEEAEKVAREAAGEFIRRRVVPGRSRAAGKIVFTSSVHEVIPWARHANYAASKGGVMLLMKSVAQKLAPHRIRVNSIAPGAIKTRINRAACETPEKWRQETHG